MAPTDLKTIQSQTREIISCLLDEGEFLQCRLAQAGNLEVDGPEDSSEDFDPVVIAGKLRDIGDGLNGERMFRATLNDLKKAAAQEAVEAAFSKGVEAWCKAQVSQPEVAPEMQLIRASVALGLFVTKSAPELKNNIQRAMTAYLNSRVSTFVNQQGGWDAVSSV